ncbi:MAG: cyclase family protein [Acidimicrobiales bacterium]
MTKVSELLGLVEQATVFDLGRPMANGMAQSPNHPTYRHCLDRRHGDRVRADGGSAAADLLTTGCHVGTHVDALAHVSHDGRLYGGVSANDAQATGRFDVLGIQELPPFVGRGVLLDVPAVLGTDICEAAYEIGVADLEAAIDRQNTPVGPGDAVLIRSGWGAHFDQPDTYRGAGSGVPGVGEAGANWLAGKRVALAGADTIAFECLPAGEGHALLPAHRVLLVEAGINIIEALDLDGLAAAGAYEFVFVLAHLNLQGATGAPARPLALA